ncbi:hypothetical protein HPC49_21065 [Pyxidicoccus fallax]|uniref:Uncharacterized protein n=1 Tax=Pyxidicoccus fallax TaxID=394095 RepID=A0A848LPZ9_9BACT|nr:hypothetical protein [Pyxidicoccus fallax]NMO19771.1 hypothetical protein [Pyxidicoccus fallax]NPC80705.1 hypothetical protein [Pyxidicoccus fallax]
MRRFALLLCLATACAGPSRTSRPGTEPPGTRAGTPDAGAPTGTSAPEPTGPFARELPPLGKHRVDSPERVFTAEVEAAAPPTLARHEGSTRIDIPLGTEAALACFVYERPLDAAGALLAVAKAVGAGPGVTVRRMEPTEVAVVADAPALFLRVDYESSAPGGVAGAGQMKLMVNASRELPLLCAHDEPGYSKTFRRITTDLARSLQVPGRARSPARREEMRVLKLDGRLAGFDWRTSRSVGGDTTRTEATTSLLLPVAGGGLRAEDSTTTTLTDAKNHLVELRHARAEDGALALQVTLRREREPAANPGASGPEGLTVPGTTYRYEGRQGTKALKGTFTSKRGLATEEDVRLVVEKWLLAGGKSEVVLDVYRPAEDVTAPVELTLRRASTANALTLTVGASTAQATVGTGGRLERTEVTRPEGKLTSELVHVQAPGAP